MTERRIRGQEYGCSQHTGANPKGPPLPTLARQHPAVYEKCQPHDSALLRSGRHGKKQAQSAADDAKTSPSHSDRNGQYKGDGTRKTKENRVLEWAHGSKKSQPEQVRILTDIAVASDLGTQLTRDIGTRGRIECGIYNDKHDEHA